MRHSVSKQIICARGLIETPHFQDELRPSRKLIDFEMKIKGMGPYEHLAVLKLDNFYLSVGCLSLVGFLLTRINKFPIVASLDCHLA
jgi:hypothetical protein